MANPIRWKINPQSNCAVRALLSRHRSGNSRPAIVQFPTIRHYGSSHDARPGESGKPTGHGSIKWATQTPAEAREIALQASRLQRRIDAEAAAEKSKAEGKEHQKRYDTAARKWVSTMIALPILLVTSYYLFDRLALGNAPKTLPRDTKSRQHTN